MTGPEDLSQKVKQASSTSSERLKGRLFRALIKIRSGGDGHISIRITIAKDITLETDFNIAPTSPIFKAANPLPYGTIVEVSGQFMKDPQQKDYFEETRITEFGGLESPSFKIQMTSFKALD